MIDVENHVFDAVYPYVVNLVPAGGFRSEYVPAPASFPCATLMEMDNITNQRMRSTAEAEDFATVTYEASVYALNKAECRAVMDGIDEGMNALNFSRMSMRFVPNLEDSRIYRIVARYQADVNGENVVFRH